MRSYQFIKAIHMWFWAESNNSAFANTDISNIRYTFFNERKYHVFRRPKPSLVKDPDSQPLSHCVRCWEARSLWSHYEWLKKDWLMHHAFPIDFVIHRNEDQKRMVFNIWRASIICNIWSANFNDMICSFESDANFLITIKRTWTNL